MSNATQLPNHQHKINIVWLSVVLIILPIVIILPTTQITTTKAFASLQWQEFWTLLCYWSGAVLIRTKIKFYWLTTILLLLSVILVNLYIASTKLNTDLAPLYGLQFFFSISSLLTVTLSAQYLNAKLFDRRDQFHIFGFAERYTVQTPATLTIQNEAMLDGKVTSISLSGALLTLQNLPARLPTLGCSLSIKEFALANQDVHIVEVAQNNLRLEFADMPIWKKWRLKKKLQKQK